MEIESGSGSVLGPQDGTRVEGVPPSNRGQDARDTPVWGPFKYCPKCGAAALRAVGVKLLRCASCGFELYLNPAAAVAGVVVDEQGRMVVLVRGKEPGKGQWDLPGGFVDPGETAEEALRREVREEIGLEVTALRYLGSGPNVYEYMGVRYRTLDMGFVCETTGVSLAKPREAEIAEVLFLKPQEIDLGRFAFRSVGTIAGRYLEQRGAEEGKKVRT
jgi:NADH pyrophosphatase NudC (nudix superfamily)